MSKWSYRIVQKQTMHCKYFALEELYFNPLGEVESFTNSSEDFYENVDELIADLRQKLICAETYRRAVYNGLDYIPPYENAVKVIAVEPISLYDISIPVSAVGYQIPFNETWTFRFNKRFQKDHFKSKSGHLVIFPSFKAEEFITTKSSIKPITK